MPIVLKSWPLNLLEPSGPPQACNGIGFFFAYLQRVLYSTCPDHHISNVYCILHAPFISTPFSAHRNDSHFAPSSLSCYFPLSQIQTFLTATFLKLFSKRHFRFLEHHMPNLHLTLLQACVLSDKTSQHNMQT